jgi:hypothetical protein
MANEALDHELPTAKSSDDAEGFHEQIDPRVEAKLVRKLDLFIIPITMALYLLSFLDRVNIGNAR